MDGGEKVRKQMLQGVALYSRDKKDFARKEEMKSYEDVITLPVVLKIANKNYTSSEFKIEIPLHTVPEDLSTFSEILMKLLSLKSPGPKYLLLYGVARGAWQMVYSFRYESMEKWNPPFYFRVEEETLSLQESVNSLVIARLGGDST